MNVKLALTLDELRLLREAVGWAAQEPRLSALAVLFPPAAGLRERFMTLKARLDSAIAADKEGVKP